MTTVSTGRRDDRAKVRTLLHEAESARLLIEVVPRNDRSPIIASSAKRAWEDGDMFAEYGVEILVKDPKDAHECGRIHYQISMFRGGELSHPSGDWMIAWCGRQHLKF